MSKFASELTAIQLACSILPESVVVIPMASTKEIRLNLYAKGDWGEPYRLLGQVVSKWDGDEDKYAADLEKKLTEVASGSLCAELFMRRIV